MNDTNLEHIRTVLLDIEGTICPISFVKDVLFPYALAALPDVLAQKWDDPAFTFYRDAFPADARASPELLEAHVRDLTAKDVKVASLKGLQGYLWRTGFEFGVYTSPLFADVVPRLKEWHAGGIQLAIFSSGSVAAQKLLFQHVGVDNGHIKEQSGESKSNSVGDQGLADNSSRKGNNNPEGDKVDSEEIPSTAEQRNGAGDKGKEQKQEGQEEEEEEEEEEEGKDQNEEEIPQEKVQEPSLPEKPESSIDLTHLFSGFFDTVNAGPKTEKESYIKIATELGRKASEVLFLSDNVHEIRAALAANMPSLLTIRPGNAAISDADKATLTIISSLHDVEGLPINRRD